MLMQATCTVRGRHLHIPCREMNSCVKSSCSCKQRVLVAVILYSIIEVII
ncbi:hypothetical protein GLYMA_06G192050v4 [Glycine max]|nr:hypothetical protein GLYMA_06G192050v4 [Glycine max]KAH1126652.1 hypothetical protein GYH30_015591 [Glycine max]